MSGDGVLAPALVELRFEALLAANRVDDALELVRTQLPHHPDSAWIWFLLCRACLTARKWPDAEDAARRAVALDPANDASWVNLGLALFYQGKQVEAVDAAARAVELYPEEAQNHYWLGYIYAFQAGAGDVAWSKALDAAATALSLDAEVGDFHWLAAQASEALRKREDAARYLAQGLAVDPDNRRLLVLGTSMSRGEAVVGNEMEVLRSLLSRDPMDHRLQWQLRGQAFARLRRLALRPWLQVVTFCFAAAFVPAAADGGTVPVAVVLAFLFAWRSRRYYRRLRGELPEGYLQELVQQSRLAGTGLRLVVAGMLAVTAGTLFAAIAGTGDPLRWALAATAAATGPAVIGYQLLLTAEGWDGQPAGSRYERPASRKSSTGLVLLGCLVSLLALVHLDRLAYAGASLVALALMAGAILLGGLIRSAVLPGAAVPSTWRGRAALLAALLGRAVRSSPKYVCAVVAIVAALALGGSLLLVRGGTPEPLPPSPDAPERDAGVPVPQPDFTFSPVPQPDFTPAPIPLPQITLPPVPTN